VDFRLGPTLSGHLGGPLAFGPDGGRLAVACRDHTVAVWDLLPAVDEGPAGSWAQLPPSCQVKLSLVSHSGSRLT
jgi:WD40 repeat protein